ncbi:metal-dependent hydrolase [Ancylobacter sp. TS-1]|uniref:metal-dependent hydrolase n=1 Tax=Ancylobacter sp. TS-1 TaxID=1850374 RepID=UPI001265CBDF|nr:metal-dependent hydrolase [Ancylobacter sp. TS-1]QFR32200.1 metal-dependent hydrolase [Ancylobacter sp. TS-1]
MKITWFGHSAFRFDFAGRAVLIDPFLTGNPGFKGDVASASAGVRHILLTHGHFDHVGDTVDIAAANAATVVANADLAGWLGTQGVESLEMMNTGGTIHLDGFSVSMVRADHSSGMVRDGATVYLGNANGLIVKAPGEPTIWHMGDTDIFSDMALIAEIHQPDVVIVPIGDRFTMGPETAALAVSRYLGGLTIIPAHYASFGLLEANAERFVALVGDEATVKVPESGVAFVLGR